MAKKKSKIKIEKMTSAEKKAKRTSNNVGGQTSYSFPEIKKIAITLGMPFPDATDSDYWRLLSYVNNTNEKPDPSLVEKYDNWVDEQLEKLGYDKNDPMRSNQLRLGYLSEEARMRQALGIKKKKEKPVKEASEKKKHERDEHNLWKGTKKSYTFELTKKGYDLERIQRRVLKAFPEANAKSIKQWHRAALKRIKNG